MNRFLLASTLLAGTLVVFATHVSAAESNETKIARAKSAAPDAVSGKATVVDVDGTVLQKGENAWTCMPGIGPGDNHPMCNDKTWMTMMQAVGAKKAFSTDRVGISYMLQGDAKVSNANPYAKDHNNGDVWVQEGPHLMIIAPKELLHAMTDDPNNGGPYVMWKDTPYAHIMVPVVATAE